MIRAFVVKLPKAQKDKGLQKKDFQIKLYRVKNKAHSNFQLPIDLSDEDFRYPLTGFKQVTKKEVRESEHLSKIIETVEDIQRTIYDKQNVFLQRDMICDFLLDVNQQLWLMGTYSQEFKEFIEAQSAANDGEIYDDSPNKKFFVDKFIQDERTAFHQKIVTQTLEQKLENSKVR